MLNSEKFAYLIFLGISIGIIVGVYFELKFIFPLFLLFTSVFASLFFKFLNLYKSFFLNTALLLMTLSVGIFVNYLSDTKAYSIESAFYNLLDKEIQAQMIVSNEPDTRQKYQFLTLKYCYDGICANLRAKDYMFTDIEYGDLVEVKGIIEKIENFDERFDYKGYLQSKGIYYNLKIKQLRKLKSGTGLKRILFEIKSYFSRNISSFLPKEESALALGLTLGMKQGLSDKYKKYFQKTGLMHIVVLSGFNITVLFLFVNKILFWLGRNARLVSSIIFIILFVLMVGADPPTLRAGIMGVLGALALLFNRDKSNVKHLLILTGILMLLISPKSILYDPGFQMSFVVALGIINHADSFLKMFRFIKIKFIAEIISSSMVAFMFASPFILYYMGYVSLISIIANTAVLPIVPIAMFFTLALGVLPIGYLQIILSLISHVLLKYILIITEFLSNIPFYQIDTYISMELLIVFCLVYIVSDFNKTKLYTLLNQLPVKIVKK